MMKKLPKKTPQTLSTKGIAKRAVPNDDEDKTKVDINKELLPVFFYISFSNSSPGSVGIGIPIPNNLSSMSCFPTSTVSN